MTFLQGWPVYDVIAAITILACLSKFLMGELKIPKAPQIKLLIAFFAATLLTHIVHTHLQALIETFEYTSKLFVFCLLVMLAVQTIRQTKIVFGIIVFTSIFMAIHGIMQQEFGYGFAGLQPIGLYHEKLGIRFRSRFFGVFNDPNDFAQALIGSIPMVWMMFKKLNGATIIIALTINIIQFIGIYGAYSRGGYVAIGAMIFSLLIFVLPSKIMTKVIIISFPIVLIIISYGTFRGWLDASATDRVIYWGMGNQLFKQHPIFGVGYGLFGGSSGLWKAVHNSYVQIYSELGLVGYIPWFGLLFISYFGCIKAKSLVPETDEDRYIIRVAKLLSVAILSYAAGSYFLSRAYTYQLFLIIALAASVFNIVENRIPLGDPPFLDWKKHVVPQILMASIGSIFFIYATILAINKLL